MNGSRWLLTSVDSCSWIIFNVVQLRALLRPQVWEGLSWEWLVSIGVSAYTNIYSEPCHNASVPPIVMHIEAGFFSAHVLWPLPLVLEKYREIFSPWNACLNDEIEAWKGYNAETQANNTPHCASNRCFCAPHDPDTSKAKHVAEESMTRSCPRSKWQRYCRKYWSYLLSSSWALAAFFTMLWPNCPIFGLDLHCQLKIFAS